MAQECQVCGAATGGELCDECYARGYRFCVECGVLARLGSAAPEYYECAACQAHDDRRALQAEPSDPPF